MSSQPPNKRDPRERTLYRYLSALERGDFDTVTAVLSEAEHDAALEQMILETNEALSDECRAAIELSDEKLINQLVRQHMPSAVANAEEDELPAPVTVGDVMARLKSDVETTRDIRQEMDEVGRRLDRLDQALPDNLNLRSVREFLGRLGLSASQSFQKVFRETAIFLSMGREQRVLAATRRQDGKRKARKEKKK
jgi:uncharacterized protein YicC (UPF0701 family)